MKWAKTISWSLVLMLTSVVVGSSRGLAGTSQGDDRNRTGVNGFAGRCVATPPRRQKHRKGTGAEAASGGDPRASGGVPCSRSTCPPRDGRDERVRYEHFAHPLAALSDRVSAHTASRRSMS